jgi:ketosteroid isomerase-like protein
MNRPEGESPAVAVVAAWHAALNAGDVERLLALSSDDVEVGGPRGSGRGAQLLREWVARANVRLEPRRFVHRGDTANTVVVEQRAAWQTEAGGAGGEPAGAQDAASVFAVEGGRVARVIRYGSMDEALREAGLSS